MTSTVTRLSFAEILAAVAQQAGVSQDDITGPAPRGSRSPKLLPRRRFVLLIRRLRPDLSWRRIGRRLNDRDAPQLYRMMRVAERELGEGRGEKRAVREVLALLGVAELPPPAPKKLANLDASIRGQLRLLVRLRAKRREMLQGIAA